MDFGASMERPDLAGYAARSAHSRGRKHLEELKDERRQIVGLVLANPQEQVTDLGAP